MFEKEPGFLVITPQDTDLIYGCLGFIYYTSGVSFQLSAGSPSYYFPLTVEKDGNSLFWFSKENGNSMGGYQLNLKDRIYFYYNMG